MTFPEDGDTPDDAPVIIDTDALEEGEEVFVGFADEEEAEAEETPLIKRLREQNRSLSRQLNQTRKTPQSDDDPEPVVPARPNLERDFNFDADRFDEAMDTYEAAKEARIKWEAREDRRKADRERATADQTRAIEQQKRALGVSDFDERAAHVHDRLSEMQIGALLAGAEKPAALIYALGSSPAKLDMIAGEDSLPKFLVMVGKLEKDLKMGKRQPPAPETRVNGGSATLSGSTNKELQRLEREAEKTGDRSAVIRYKREQRAAA